MVDTKDMQKADSSKDMSAFVAPKAPAHHAAASQPSPAQRKANIQAAQQQGLYNYNGIPLDAHGLIAGLPPEIQAIFNDAANAAATGNPWDTSVFQGKLVSTDWWKSTPESARTYQWTSIIDPAQATQQANQAAFQVLEEAKALGRPITLAQAADIGHQMILNNWNQQQLQNYMATTPLHQGQQWGPGNVETEMANVRKTAGDYGINVSGPTAQTWAQRIAGGNTDQAAFEDYARTQAKLNHPYWEKQLDQGFTVRQLADPYIQQASNLLEVNPDQINLANTAKWDFATTQKDGTRVPMSQSQWQQQLMTDPKYGWDATNNAKQDAYNVVDQLRQSFGAG